MAPIEATQSSLFLMIKHFLLSGVKSFSDQTALRLAPLTILTGTNSSGKSTIFQVLLAIKQTYESPLTHFAGLHLNGKHVSLGTFKDWSSEHREGPVFLELLFEVMPYELQGIPFEKRRAHIGMPRSIQLRPQFWWMPPSGLLPGQLPRNAYGKMTLRLEKADEITSMAMLGSFCFSCSYEVKDATQITYVIQLNKHEIPPILDIDIDEPDVADAEFEYDITVEETPPMFGRPRLEGAEASSRTTPTVKYSARAAIDGLTATAVLFQTRIQAVERTMRRIVVSVIREFCGLIAGYSSGATGPPRRFNPATHILSPDSSKTKLNRAINFLEKAEPHELAIYLQLSDTLEYVQAFFTSFYMSRMMTSQKHLDVLNALFGRMRYFATSRGPKTESSEYGHVSNQLKTLSAHFSRRDSVFDFIGDMFACEGGTGGLSEVRSLIETAASQVERAQAEYSVAPVRQWLDHPELLAQRRMDPASGTFYARRERRISDSNIRSFFINSLFHLGPLREEPRKLYVSEPPSSITDVGQRGERAIACLRWFGDESILAPAIPVGRNGQPTIQRTKLLQSVLEWGQFLGIYGDLIVESDAKFGTICEVVAGTKNDTVKADLTNVGTGVSQLLPVLVLCLSAPVGSTILIEQPELHLHPAVQSRLGEFFFASIFSGRQIIVETHSEHLINRLRLLAATGVLVPERDASILFLKRDKFGSESIPIEIMPDGSFSRWPDQFFDEAEKVLAEMFRVKFSVNEEQV
jgi:hypothetical protein